LKAQAQVIFRLLIFQRGEQRPDGVVSFSQCQLHFGGVLTWVPSL
jgi:hypothetical protein